MQHVLALAIGSEQKASDMCKWLANILFPLEVLNRKRNIVIWHKAAGVTASTITWVGGDRIVIKFGNLTWALGTSPASFSFPSIELDVRFECINTTSLIVNGQVLI